MQPKQMTRKHLDHQHQMTLSTPQRDNRDMAIPEGTFTAVEGPSFSLPFRYLRTWFFSLLAIIILPIGLMMLFIGAEIQEHQPEWTRTQATVNFVGDDGLSYTVDEEKGYFSYVLDDFVDLPIGAVQIQLTACDLVSRFVIPQETGATFTLWVNPDDMTQHSCTPIDTASGEIYFSIGLIILAFCGWRLMRTIHAAGLQPKKA